MFYTGLTSITFRALPYDRIIELAKEAALDGIEWGGEKAYLVFGLAGADGEHLAVLANIAKALEDEDVVEKMRTTDNVDWLLSVLS